MKKNYKKRGAWLMSLLLLGMTVLSMTSCTAWNWLWSREPSDSVDREDLILGGNVPEDTDVIFEGAVSYTGEAHSGTDIYYIGQAGSPNRNRIIVIDPGHQFVGSDAQEPNGPGSEVMKAEVTWGATGVVTGQNEYELNLRVALLLRDVLIRRGYSVVMIRETNKVSISNMERAEIANKYSAAAYIRIHANSWTDDSMHGAMTISQSASNPYPDCALHYERSSLLSHIVLDEFCEQTGIHKLDVREMDDMTGTNWSRVPTTIVEMGFLSNKSDDKLMESDYFRQEAAIGIANGLDRYFRELEEMETQPETETAAKPVDNSPKPVVTPAPEDEATSEPTEATDTETATVDATDEQTEPASDTMAAATADATADATAEATDEGVNDPDTSEEVTAETAEGGGADSEEEITPDEEAVEEPPSAT